MHGEALLARSWACCRVEMSVGGGALMYGVTPRWQAGIEKDDCFDARLDDSTLFGR